ncbi:MAG: SurA N-terminal domain-containing protein [Oceanidesulfovibrio sp.]
MRHHPVLYAMCIALTLTLALHANAQASEPVPSDAEIIAAQDNSTLLVVNGEAVPRWMFDNALRDVLGTNNTAENVREHELLHRQRAILDNLVVMELLEQEAHRQGLTVSLSGGALRTAIVRNGFDSPEDFRRTLAKAGMTEKQYTTIWSQQASANRLVDEKVAASVSVSEDELRDRFEQDKHKYRNASFEDVRDQLLSVVAGEKRHAAFERYLASLLDKADVRVVDPHLRAVYEDR